MAKGFQFRFESLLRLRKQERDVAGKAVGDAEQAIEILQNQVTEISDQRDALRQTSSTWRTSQTIQVDRLMNEGRYDLQLVAQLEDLTTKTKQIVAERERRLVRLQEANAEVRRLERLKERQQAEWKQQQLVAEQAMLDDIAAGRYLRQVRSDVTTAQNITAAQSYDRE